MPRRQLPSQIRKIDVVDRQTGKIVVRYQVTVDTGIRDIVRTRPDGSSYLEPRRTQTRRRFESEQEARACLARITDEVNRGVHVTSSASTINEVCAAWLAGRRVRPTTKAAYEHALTPLRQRHGSMPIQKLTKGHLDQLVNDLIEGSVPNKKGVARRPWNPQSINPMLDLVSAVLNDQMKQGFLVRNVASLVDRVPRTRKKMQTFTEQQMRQLLRSADQDRVGQAWYLALSGLRRGEVCGLRWADLDLDNGFMTVQNTRVSVNGQATEGTTKTEASMRVLPLTETLISVLRSARSRQTQEKRQTGESYGPGAHVVCDETGHPYHPDTLSSFWSTICRKADVPRIRLHDARHTCATLMHLQNVPIAVISAWLGHTDAAFTMRTYAHSQNEALRLAAASLQSMVLSRNDIPLN